MALKGFIFSIDALYAAAVLIFAGVLLLSSINTESPKEKQFDLVKRQAMDESQVGFMLNKTGGVLQGNEKYAYCQKIFLYNPDNGLQVKGAVQSKQYCSRVIP
jgi:hypothetical protein